MRIFLVVNRETYKEAVVAVTSLCLNTKADIEAVVVSDDLNENDRETMIKALEEYRIKISFSGEYPGEEYVYFPTNIIVDSNIEELVNDLSGSNGEDSLESHALIAPDAHDGHMGYNDVKGKYDIILYPEDRPWLCTNIHYDIEKIWWEYAEHTPLYHDFLEGFLKSAMEDTFLEDYAIKICDENDKLTDTINEVREKISELSMGGN